VGASGGGLGLPYGSKKLPWQKVHNGRRSLGKVGRLNIVQP